MKKIMKLFISVLLVLVMLCSLTACGNKDTKATEDLQSTGSNIVENGKSDYVIVIPEGNDYATNIAANELNTFLELSALSSSLHHTAFSPGLSSFVSFL